MNYYEKGEGKCNLKSQCKFEKGLLDLVRLLTIFYIDLQLIPQSPEFLLKQRAPLVKNQYQNPIRGMFPHL